jgi:hypothetical protein
MVVELEGTTSASKAVVTALEDQMVTGNAKEQPFRVDMIFRDRACQNRIGGLIACDLPDINDQEYDEDVSPDEKG